MKLHFFTKGGMQDASSRQRVFNIVKELKRLGVSASVYQPGVWKMSTTSWPHKFFLIRDVLKYILGTEKKDVIFLHRTVYNKYFFLIIVFISCFLKRGVVFDFDDAVYRHSFIQTVVLVYLADVVVVGGHELRVWASSYNEKVFIIPTSIDFKLYQEYTATHEKDSLLSVGWVGSAKAHKQNLKILSRVFSELDRQGIRIRFTLLGSLGIEEVHELFEKKWDHEIQIIDEVNWSDTTAVPKIIQGFDVGVMPLHDTAWNRGKCAFKAIQYMACGVPTIASRVGESVYVIDSGKDGWLVDSLQEWVDVFELLDKKREVLAEAGSYAQQKVKEEYSYAVNTSRLVQILKRNYVI